MEEEVTRLVENTFVNYSTEETKRIIIERILWYEEELVNSVSKDKIREILNKYGKKDIGYAVDFYKEIEQLLED